LPPPSPPTLREATRRFESQQILAQLSAHNWQIQNTAKALGIDRTHLYRKIRFFKIVPPEGTK
jgi:transcriptional regulator of acetoin/glycerol metabolism